MCISTCFCLTLKVLSIAINNNNKKGSFLLAAFFGEGIFTMGCSKNYIMYWGVFTVIIVS